MSTNPADSLDQAATRGGGSRPKPEKSLGDLDTGADVGRTASDLDAAVRGLEDLDLETVDLQSRYEIVGPLGRGGMGEVLKAVDRRLRRPVAIKRVRGDLAHHPQALARFLTEARAVAALNHFNIVQIYDYGRSAEGPFLAMEFVDGESLAQRLERGPLPVEEAVDLTCQLCDALALAHGQGIIHRDIKPANILLTATGVPKLSDFGLARREGADHGQTQTGAVLGTLDFMPPEQRLDATKADARSDLWSLAATFYQMLTGKPPKVIRLTQVPSELRPILEKALEDDPGRRFQTAADLRHSLRESLTRLRTAMEVMQLTRHIKSRIDARQFEGLLDRVNRLLELRPSDKSLVKVRDQLLDRERHLHDRTRSRPLDTLEPVDRPLLKETDQAAANAADGPAIRRRRLWYSVGGVSLLLVALLSLGPRLTELFRSSSTVTGPDRSAPPARRENPGSTRISSGETSLETLAQKLQKRFHGKTEYNPASKELSLSYNFSDAKQLEDFDWRGNLPRIESGALKLEGGEVIRHCVPFQTLALSVDAVPEKDEVGIGLRTTNGLMVVADDHYQKLVPWISGPGFSREPGGAVGQSPWHVELALTGERVTLKFGESSIGRDAKMLPGKVELLGGRGGSRFRGLKVKGLVDEGWIKSRAEENPSPAIPQQSGVPEFLTTIRAGQLQAKLRGKVSYESSTGVLALKYDFSDPKQLLDFDVSPSQAFLESNTIVVAPGAAVRHTVAFKSVTVTTELVPQGDPVGVGVRTSTGLKAVGDSHYADFVPWISGPGFRDNGRRVGESPWSLEFRVTGSRAAIALGAGSVGRETTESAGRIELLGGTGGCRFRNLTISGVLDKDWVKLFLTK